MPTTELTVYRHELKYPPTRLKASLIQRKLSAVLTPDVHGERGVYTVRSLYFDTPDHKDYHDKLSGLYARKKYRLRTYNGDPSLCKLEKKEKIGDLQRKQSLLLPYEDAVACAAGQFDVLRKYFDTAPFAVTAYAELQSGCYRPAILIEYERCAYHYPLYDTRITLDQRLRKKEGALDLFSDSGYLPLAISDEYVILEVKYSGKPLELISDLLASFHLEQISYSKYCSGSLLYESFSA